MQIVLEFIDKNRKSLFYFGVGVITGLLLLSVFSLVNEVDTLVKKTDLLIRIDDNKKINEKQEAEIERLFKEVETCKMKN